MTAEGVGSRLLLVSPCIEDHSSLRRIFHHSPWEMYGVFRGSDALSFLHNHHLVPVVICECKLPDGDWKLVLRECDSVPVRPNLIVSARMADERLWAEVLNMGAFDLLAAAPFEAEEVIRVTESAWLAWNRGRGQTVAPRIGPGLAWSGQSSHVQDNKNDPTARRSTYGITRSKTA
jgi:DNA-binding NtrC family response regulator